MLRRFLFCLAGLFAGALAALGFTFAVLFLFPILTGSGGDEMSQGLMGTLVYILSVPVFGLLGVFYGYKYSLNSER